MEADPNVRLRIETRLYSLRAARVERREEFGHFSNAWEAKYERR